MELSRSSTQQASHLRRKNHDIGSLSTLRLYEDQATSDTFMLESFWQQHKPRQHDLVEQRLFNRRKARYTTLYSTLRARRYETHNDENLFELIDSKICELLHPTSTSHRGRTPYCSSQARVWTIFEERT